MPTPPTRISVTETASWATSGASKSIASISWQIGDVLVAAALSEGSGTSLLAGPTNTGTGLTWVNQKAHTSAGDCSGRLSTAVATAADSGVISMTESIGDHWGFAVWIYRGSDGVGNSAEQDTTVKTVPLIPTAANSAMVWIVGDWSAEAAHAGTPTPTTTVEATADSPHYSAHAFDLTDQTSAGSVSYGVSSGGSTGPYTILVCEIKGAAGGAVFMPKANAPIGQAVQRAASW